MYEIVVPNIPIQCCKSVIKTEKFRLIRAKGKRK
jgi:hypothetical protein